MTLLFSITIICLWLDFYVKANVNKLTVSVLGQNEGCVVKYSPLRKGTSERGGLYLTIYSESGWVLFSVFLFLRGQYFYILYALGAIFHSILPRANT